MEAGTYNINEVSEFSLAMKNGRNSFVNET